MYSYQKEDDQRLKGTLQHYTYCVLVRVGTKERVLKVQVAEALTNVEKVNYPGLTPDLYVIQSEPTE